MSPELFWEIIEQARKQSNEGLVSKTDALIEVLLTLCPQAIVEFQTSFEERLQEAFRKDFEKVYELIKSCDSTWSFRDFCSFVISEGKIVFQRALLNPDNLSELDNIGDEELRFYDCASQTAYVTLTGESLPNTYDPRGKDLKDDEIKKLFPRLCARFDSRS